MNLNFGTFFSGLAVVSALATPLSHAEIVLHGTRVIYPSDAREVTLQLSNNGNKPSLVQAWIDDGDAKSTPDQSQVPFMISPPISRVEAEKGQTLRITALPTAAQLDQKQETIFWLNVIDIPPKPSAKDGAAVPENFVQLAIRSRIKFFYRPAAIKTDLSTAVKQLQWRQSGAQLVINNPSPMHITMISIFQNQRNIDKPVDLLPQGLMIKPFSEEKVDLKGQDMNSMQFVYINDFGGRIEHAIKLQ